MVHHFQPSITININNCTDNTTLGITTKVKIPVLLRRRGDCTNIAGGVLTHDTSHVYITCSNVRHFFPTSHVRLANGPIHRGLFVNRRTGPRTCRFFNLGPRGPALLVMNKDLNTHAVGRSIVGSLGGLNSDNVRIV